jgi:hypothetical protein
VLAIDGRHQTVLFTVREGQQVGANRLVFNDQQEKYLAFEAAARTVAMQAIDEVIVSGEVWIAEAVPDDDLLRHVRPGDREDRAEAFVTYGANRDGESLTLISEISREDGGLVFGQPEQSDVYPNALDPIRRVWERGGPRRERDPKP